jgi:hypothetical protein
LDRGKGDVDDRRVEDDHQLAQADDEERDPAPAVAAGLVARYGVIRSLQEDRH